MTLEKDLINALESTQSTYDDDIFNKKIEDMDENILYERKKLDSLEKYFGNYKTNGIHFKRETLFIEYYTIWKNYNLLIHEKEMLIYKNKNRKISVKKLMELVKPYLYKNETDTWVKMEIPIRKR